ncbi:hypothetical protein HG535_0F06240 [Zygotorulaspora mrakii]|uniref:Alpha-1,3-mannosyltransferase n=1 Tax=Zygotorulaspora mrakii TaxID=42260 RepID=A0A7H9B8P8_ZYGMR|nr:uncharacterized protein HG535_0F06240 [Zygotorulaspora mrakii]QLG74112.1 hypothetical protein HG535_0F06240 [Zygotorulaspora mrakii]
MNEKWKNDLSTMAFGIKDFKDEDIEKFKDSDGFAMIDEESVRMFKKRNDIALAFERMRIYDTCLMQDETVNLQETFEQKRETNLVQGTQNKKEKREFSGVSSGTRDENYRKFDQYDFEHRMFPFIRQFNHDNFSQIIPKFTSPFNKVLKQGDIPIFDPKSPMVNKVINYVYDPTKSFWKNWNLMSAPGSRGIVLSFADSHLAMALKLIATLRFQGNKLPIQVIYKKGDLSEDTIEKISYAARSPNVTLPETKYGNPANEPQEIWFLDVTNTLADNMISEFSHWKGKWLAVLFNLFDEFVFLDIDAINYIDLNDYFESPEYKRTGTVYFRDRVLSAPVSNQCTAIFESLPPKLLEMKYFSNRPFIHSEYLDEDCEKDLTTEEKIYKRFFMDNFQHQMESGLFAISKSKHHIPLVISMTLHLAKKVGSCGWGDKEYFWLGFVVAGRPFSFNEVPAASVGTYQEKKDLDLNRKEEAGEVCSIQVSHISVDGKLLWLNGGSNNCKAPGAAEKDWNDEKLKSFTGTFDSLEALKEYYEVTPIDTSRAVIPHESSGVWYRRDLHCNGYAWCAKYQSILKEYSFDRKKFRGKIVEFDPKDVIFTTAMNYVWSHYDDSDAKKFTAEEKASLDPLAGSIA